MLPKLIDQAIDLGISDRVIFTGRLTDDEVKLLFCRYFIITITEYCLYRRRQIFLCRFESFLRDVNGDPAPFWTLKNECLGDAASPGANFKEVSLFTVVGFEDRLDEVFRVVTGNKSSF